jgi:hypothetical protein
MVLAEHNGGTFSSEILNWHLPSNSMNLTEGTNSRKLGKSPLLSSSLSFYYLNSRALHKRESFAISPLVMEERVWRWGAISGHWSLKDRLSSCGISSHALTPFLNHNEGKAQNLPVGHQPPS